MIIAIFEKALVESQYIVSCRWSIEHYEWRFIPVNMKVAVTWSSDLFSISPSTMPSSIKVCYIILTTEIYFLNPSQVPEYLWPHALFNTRSSSTQLKVLSNWSIITTFVFPYITLSIECISKFLSARRKHFEEMKPFDSHSSLNFRCFKLWFESFGNIFYNASAL